jgi:hypothetical protein
VILEELTTKGKAMVDKDLSKGKQQSLKDRVEEEVKRTPT